MDNPNRTSEYLIRCDARVAALRAKIAQLLSGAPAVTLEIGCGHGHFLTSYAEKHPHAECIGIDLLLDRVARAGRKKERSRLKNLHFIQAEANEFLAALPEQTQLADIFVLFPDPWPKRRHHKNRLIKADLLTRLAARAVENARVCFRTDHAGYFAEARRVISAHPAWTLEPAAHWPHELVTVFQSRAAGFESLVAFRNNLPAPAPASQSHGNSLV